MTIKITSANFSTQLKGLVKSATNQRDKLQALIIFGFEHANQCGDFCHLTTVLNAIIPVKAFRTSTAKDFIKAHVTNLSWAKGKDGKYQFVKTEKGVDCVITMPTTLWYEYDNKGNATEDVDIIAQVKALQTRISKMLNGQSDKQIKAEQREIAFDISQALDSLLALAPAKK